MRPLARGVERRTWRLEETGLARVTVATRPTPLEKEQS